MNMKQYVLGIKIGAAFDSTFSTNVSKAKRDLENLNKYADLKLRLDNKIGDARNKLGESMQGWQKAAGVAAAITIPVKIGADFSFQMETVGALLDVTGKKFEALEAKAMELGSATKYSSSQVGAAMEYLAKAGFTTEEVLATIGPTLNLATAGNLDLARAADISSDILSGFGLQAQELTRVTDVLAKTAISSNSSVESIGEAMKYVAPIAKAMGVSVEEASAMLGKLHDVGIKGSMAGTTLRSMMSRLSAPTGQAASALQKLGVQVTDAYGNMLPMQEILKNMGERMELLPESKKMEVVKNVFGEEPAAGAIELITQANTGKLDEYIKTLENAEGSAGKIVNRLNDTVVGKFKSVLSALEGIFLNLYKPIEPLIKLGLDILIGGMRAFTSVLKVVAPVLSPIVFLMGSAYVASKAWSIGMAALRLQSLLFSKTLLTMSAKLPFAAGGLNMLGKSSIFANMSFKTLFATIKTGGVALLTNPVFLVGAALAGAAMLIIANWEKVKAFFVGFGAGIAPAFAPLFGIGKSLANVFSPLFKVLGSLFSFIRSLFGGDSVDTSKYESFGQKVGTSFRYAFMPLTFVFKLISGVFGLIGSFFNFIIKSATAVSNILVAPFKLFISILKSVFGTALNVIANPFGAIKALVGNLSSFIGTIFKGIGNMLTAPFKAMEKVTGSVFSVIGKGLNGVLSFAKEGFSTIMELPGKAIAGVKNFLTKPIKAIGGFFSGIFGNDEKEKQDKGKIKENNTFNQASKEKEKIFEYTTKEVTNNNVINNTSREKEKEKVFTNVFDKVFSKESTTEKIKENNTFNQASKEKEKIEKSNIETFRENSFHEKVLQAGKEEIYITISNININSNNPVQDLKDSGTEIKEQLKKAFREVFDDMKRKQALAYNK
jgi:TP901 family phage tail tape measure protein